MDTRTPLRLVRMLPRRAISSVWPVDASEMARSAFGRTLHYKYFTRSWQKVSE
ncbi:Uncharacterized protein DAT39_003156 [Clarias magur]|uniref:Uncharacterized protein n=1 Tax=Clarias magur TaxID=1594786 RepID=A0A8J4X7C0_CLAMG|nr:Uncharacterized protein DAT39_003156 [Clarias magur]